MSVSGGPEYATTIDLDEVAAPALVHGCHLIAP